MSGGAPVMNLPLLDFIGARGVRQGLEFGKDLFHRGVFDVDEDIVLLEDLPAHVEGEALGVDDLPDKAEPGGGSSLSSSVIKTRLT
jgi:hypothetical protein